MMTLRDLRGMNITRETAPGFVPRVNLDPEDLREQVVALMADVRRNGETALREQAHRFDGVVPARFRVDAKYLKASLGALDKNLRRAMEESIRRVTAASEDSIPPASVTEYHSGGQVVTRYVPVDRAGVYVPGGKAVYPSSVIMNVVAAQTAGVAEIALVSPAQKEYAGNIHPAIAAAAEILGVTEIYALGGAGAIGALAYGVPELSLAPVSVITGPGNRYVAAAKSAVRGVVGIDSEAGPTEIGIIADDTAHPEWVAADLISQAEHDELASAVLVTTSMELAHRVQAALERQAAATSHSGRVRQALTGEQSAIVVVDTLEQALFVSDAFAPEHLEVVVESPQEVVDKVRHAGAIFVGDYTPVSAGDYLAGSNHVLPTGGAGHHSSGLSPLTFLRRQQVVTYDKTALQAVADHIVVFAHAENLPAHGDAVTWRFGPTPES